MSRGIFLINNDDQLVELREQPYNSEDVLQQLLARYPNLLAGDQVNREIPRRWLLISREVSVPGEQGAAASGRLDHLFVDQDGVPTLVEVKRSTDTRIRREVVGQMLDYAANAVVYWPVEHLMELFRGECQKRGVDPEQGVADFLEPGDDPAAFWQRVKTNLQAGRVRLLFVADQIPLSLRRVVEFLNQQMDPAEVLAVEIKQFAGEGLRTLVPTVLGQTAEAERRKGGISAEPRQWDEETFFANLSERGERADVAVGRRILEWARSRRLRVWWGRGKTVGSFVPVLNREERSYQPFAVLSSGLVDLYFYWYQFKPEFSDEAKRLELIRRLNEIPGVAIPNSAVSGRPTVRLSVLARGDSLDRFLAIYDGFLSEAAGVDGEGL
jgi:hypothetical protein